MNYKLQTQTRINPSANQVNVFQCILSLGWFVFDILCIGWYNLISEMFQKPCSFSFLITLWDLGVSCSWIWSDEEWEEKSMPAYSASATAAGGAAAPAATVYVRNGLGGAGSSCWRHELPFQPHLRLASVIQGIWVDGVPERWLQIISLEETEQ